jgi:dTDP-4-amino-4,6-dideoxygalactose transaminase
MSLPGSADASSAAEPADADPIPLFDPRGQYERLKDEIDARVAAVMAHGAYVNGPEVGELEDALCRATGAAACVACANGTDALVMSLLAHGVGPGDAVFVPAFTYVATAGAVRLAGATPVFCDVREDTATLDAADLERQVERVRRRRDLTPRAVLPVDLYGLPADYAAVGQVADGRDLLLIADAAQSAGAARAGVPVGRLAPVTCVSFFPTKPLGCAGDGGAILTRDAGLAARLRTLRTHGTDASRTAVEIGMNNRLDTLQAAILLAKLPYLAAERAHRERLAARYDTGLGALVETAPREHGCDSAWALYTIRSDRREAIRQALADRRIAAAVYYHAPVHLHPAYRAFGDGPGSLPASERLADRVLSLPLTAEMSDAQVERVAMAVRAPATDDGSPPAR